MSRLTQIYSMAGLLLILVGIMVSVQPIWSPPSDFDAYGYIRMAENPLAATSVDIRQQQRPFPSLAVHVLSRISGLSIPTSFRVLANSCFVIFALLLNAMFLKRSEGDAPVSVALTALVLLSSWLITYNLSMFYQLCDMLTYVFTAVMLQAMIRQSWSPFWWVCLPALLTRQNLAILILGTFLFYGVEKVRSTKVRPGFWLRTTAFLLFALLITGGVYIMLQQHPKFFSRYFRTRPDALLQMLINLVYLSLPFTVVLILRWRDVIGVFIKYWPAALFCAATIYQPYSFFFMVRPDNALRISMQGIWLLNLVACFILIDELRARPSTWRRVMIILFPILWVGIRGLEQMAVVSSMMIMSCKVAGSLFLAIIFFKDRNRPAQRMRISILPSMDRIGNRFSRFERVRRFRGCEGGKHGGILGK